MNNLAAMIEFLNELLLIDADAITLLFANRVKCNEELSNHSTVQVDADNTVSMLGILNGMYGINENGRGKITACLSNEKIIKFVETDKVQICT